MADIDPNSWHFNFNMFFDHVDEGTILSKNTCSYVRLTLGNLLLCAMAATFAIMCFAILIVLFYFTFAPLFGVSYDGDIVTAVLMAICWTIAGSAAILFVRKNRDLFEDHDRTLFSFSERKVAKTDGLFVQWLKDKHGKICTRNRIIEDGWDKD